VAALALLFALPLALALAVFATEFSLGRLGKGVEVVLSIFSGIPPVIYGLLSVFVINLFVLPKLCADGKPEEFFHSLPGLPPYTPGLLPREDSTLLGGLFLCLLIVPFMTPLIVDAIRSVPQGLKEARWGWAPRAGIRCCMLPFPVPCRVLSWRSVWVCLNPLAM